MPDPDVTIRECQTVDEFRQCIELERDVWKDEDIDVMPIRLYMISKTCGGPTIGAFDDSNRLVGAGHMLPALVGNNVAFHSHLLAVAKNLRDKNIGYRIKLAQREHAIKAGVKMVFWTFDPLQSRNAHFNVNKLGVIIRRYGVNYYGENVSSVFEADVPSDRLIAEWWVSSRHVEAVLSGAQPRVAEVESKVTIPDDIDSIRERSVEAHKEWRLRVREAFEAALKTGAIVRGFQRDHTARRSTYPFGVDEGQFSFDASIDGG